MRAHPPWPGRRPMGCEEGDSSPRPSRPRRKQRGSGGRGAQAQTSAPGQGGGKTAVRPQLGVAEGGARASLKRHWPRAQARAAGGGAVGVWGGLRGSARLPEAKPSDVMRRAGGNGRGEAREERGWRVSGRLGPHMGFVRRFRPVPQGFLSGVMEESPLGGELMKAFCLEWLQALVLPQTVLVSLL